SEGAAAMTRACALALSFLLVTAVVATAQTATGTISGTVRDATGSVIPGVAMTIKNASTGASRGVTTDVQGRYRIANVEPGEYEMRAAFAGFRTIRRQVAVTVGGTTGVDIDMTVGDVAEE